MGKAARRLCLAALVWLTALSAHAEDGPARAVSILVGFGPAQGNDQPARPDAATLASNRMSPDMSYDQTARFLARHLGRFLPGAPSVAARHVPGGAGLIGARRLSEAAPDGSTIALLSSNVIYAAALQLPGAEASVAKLVWLGAVAPDSWGCIQTRDSLAKEKVWAGSLGIGSRADIHARAMRDLLGYPFQISSGYISRFELVRALETGEIDAACGWPTTDIERRRGQWFETGKMDVVARFSATAAGLARPAAQPSSDVAAVLGLLSLEAELAWPLAAPPGMAPETTTVLSDALEKIAYDRSAIEDAMRAGVTLDPVSAQTVRDHVAQLMTLPDGPRKKLADLSGAGGK
jgi:tripartite-type tricarboxylate transporter receptor subunit TctC